MDQHQDQPEGHQHQSQAIARAAARLAGGPQFHAHLNLELGVGHLLGLLSGAHDFALHLGPSGNRFWPPGRADELGRPADRGPGGQTGSGLIRATAAGSGQTPEENGVGAAANDAENGQTHAKWTVGEAHRRLPEMCSRPPWHLS